MLALITVIEFIEAVLDSIVPTTYLTQDTVLMMKDLSVTDMAIFAISWRNRNELSLSILGVHWIKMEMFLYYCGTVCNVSREKT